MSARPINYVRGLLGNFGVKQQASPIDAVGDQIVYTEHAQPFLSMDYRTAITTENFNGIAGSGGITNTSESSAWLIYHSSVGCTLAAGEYIRTVLTHWQLLGGASVDWPITESVESAPSRAAPAVAGRIYLHGVTNLDVPIAILMPGQALRTIVQDIITAGNIAVTSKARYREISI